MISRLLTGLLSLVAAAALAADGDPLPGGESLKASSLEELCGSREREDVQDELDRRDIFNRREMRVIRTGDMQTGIRLETLTCMKGRPSAIVDGVQRLPYGPVAAYVHQGDGSATLVSYVVEGPGETLVVAYVEGENAEAVTRDPAFRLSCLGFGTRPTGCRIVNENSPSLTRNSPSNQSDFCGERPCDSHTDLPYPITYSDAELRRSDYVDEN